MAPVDRRTVRTLQRLVLALSMIGCLLLAAGAATAAPTPGAVLLPGQSLAVGAGLRSPDGRTTAQVQGDGNVVVYRGATPLWATRTAAPIVRLDLQTDGNLVVYDRAGRPLWWTGTYAPAGVRLVLQDDGNLVLSSRGGLPLWSSTYGRTGDREDVLGTTGRLTTGQSLWSHDGGYQAVLQGDGNLVVYATAGGARWSSQTGSPGSQVVMQGDGNLVVYAPDGRPLWWSRTAGSTGVTLAMQTDGNLVLYAPSGALWSSSGGLTPRAPGQPTQQVVVTGAYGSSRAQLNAYQWTGSGWQLVASAPAEVGGAGLSDHHVEGDRTTPTGTYGFGPTMYGLSPTPPSARYGYHHLVCGDYWNGDQASGGYNSFIHVPCGSPGPGRPGASEALWPETVAYQHFAVIQYNVPAVPGRGSGIFLHDDTTSGVTAGCVAVPPTVLDQVLGWLDPAQNPVIRIGT